MTPDTCKIKGCSRRVKARGWCSTHYNRWHATGDPGVEVAHRTWPYKPRSVPWERVDKNAPGGCWLWLSTLDRSGYGRLYHQARRWVAHRFFYELLVGPIPEGLELDHLCMVKTCVNPAHLEPVTGDENIDRYLAYAGKRRTNERGAAPTSAPPVRA